MRLVWIAPALIVVSIFLLCLGWGPVGLSCRRSSILEMYQHSRYADFIITGVVVTEDGTPLDGVRVRIMASRLQKTSTESENSSQSLELPNPHFSIGRRGYSSVELSFSRAGYDTQRTSFTEGGTYEGIRIVMHPKVSKMGTDPRP
jgi:hypothetical protein